MSQVPSVEAETADPGFVICWVNRLPSVSWDQHPCAGNLLFFFSQGHQSQELPVLILASSLFLWILPSCLLFTYKGYCLSVSKDP